MRYRFPSFLPIPCNPGMLAATAFVRKRFIAE